MSAELNWDALKELMDAGDTERAVEICRSSSLIHVPNVFAGRFGIPEQGW